MFWGQGEAEEGGEGEGQGEWWGTMPEQVTTFPCNTQTYTPTGVKIKTETLLNATLVKQFILSVLSVSGILGCLKTRVDISTLMTQCSSTQLLKNHEVYRAESFKE